MTKQMVAHSEVINCIHPAIPAERFAIAPQHPQTAILTECFAIAYFS